MNKREVRRKILKSCPDFAVEDIAKIGEGMDSEAYSVNDSYIFRFPKSAEVRQNLAKEIAALPILQEKLNFKIPNFEFAGIGNSFVGYRKIEGEFLSRDLFDSFSNAEQAKIQESLAGFLMTIHRQNIDEFTKLGIEIQDFRADYKCDFEETQKNIFPLLSIEDQEFIAGQFQSYLENDENFSYQPVLLHNDLSSDHILVDAETAQINGIIDFGDIGIGDGDYDLMCLHGDYGKDFVTRFLQFYSHFDSQKLFSKLNFWMLVNDLQAVKHYLEEGNAAKFKEYKKYLLNRLDTMKNKRH